MKIPERIHGIEVRDSAHMQKVQRLLLNRKGGKIAGEKRR